MPLQQLQHIYITKTSMVWYWSVKQYSIKELSTQYNWVCYIKGTEWGNEDSGYIVIIDYMFLKDFVLLYKKIILGLRASYNFRANYSIAEDQNSGCYAETGVSCVEEYVTGYKILYYVYGHFD